MVAVIYLSLVLQLSQAAPAFVWMVLPLAVAIQFRSAAAVCWGGLNGLWWDAVSGTPLGLHLLLDGVLVAATMWAISAERSRSSLVLGMVVTVLAILHDAGGILALAVYDRQPINLLVTLEQVADRSLWTGTTTGMVMFAGKFVLRGCGWNGQWRGPVLQNQWNMLDGRE